MLNMHLRMKLSREEENFLRHWIYDEAHYLQGEGQAKRLQLQHGATPADLAILIASAMPDPADQEAAAIGPAPAQPAIWPLSDHAFHSCLAKAQAVLAERNRGQLATGVR